MRKARVRNVRPGACRRARRGARRFGLRVVFVVGELRLYHGGGHDGRPDHGQGAASDGEGLKRELHRRRDHAAQLERRQRPGPDPRSEADRAAARQVRSGATSARQGGRGGHDPPGGLAERGSGREGGPQEGCGSSSGASGYAVPKSTTSKAIGVPSSSAGSSANAAAAGEEPQRGLGIHFLKKWAEVDHGDRRAPERRGGLPRGDRGRQRRR